MAEERTAELTMEEATGMLENSTLTAMPSDKKRIIIPMQGFEGATPLQRDEWYPGQDKATTEDVLGVAFFNPTDQKTQVLKENDGCLILYDEPGRLEKIEQYLEDNRGNINTAESVTKFGNVSNKLVNFFKPLLAT